MKITVFGATGRTGRALLAAAAEAGLPTTAYVRDQARLGDAVADRVVVGSVFDPVSLRASLAGAESAVVAFSLGRDRRTPLYSRGTEMIIDAMRAEGVRRLLVVSESAYGEHVAGVIPWILAAGYRLVAGPAIRERRVQDVLVRASGLDWTFVRPVRIVAGPPRGVRAGIMTPSRTSSQTTYEDVAGLILRALPDTATHGRNLYP
ncbi:NAD(P)-binding oxidoreductase [Dactylosporangium sp. NPDC005572]|uniref:NAD(P)-dependent oxidoreductase n=1 Tax=Dactylosporangium sp. NPDC005572 TaxID=3156889 RepID=UPI0033B34C92